MSTVLTNARVVLPEAEITGTVTLAEGVITGITDDPKVTPDEVGSSAHVVDLGGDLLMPGLVELHTDQVETHYQPRPKRFWNPVSAMVSHDAQMVASGITTVLDAMRIGTGPTDGNSMAASARTLIESAIHAQDAGILKAEHFIHLRCEVSTADVVDVFDQLSAHARIRLVSLMDHTPGQRQYADVEAFKTYMVGKGRLLESEFDDHVATLRELSEQYADAHRKALAQRASERGITMAAHDDATEDHVAESHGLGVHVSEFPTTVTAARAAKTVGQLVVMGAPNIVRGGSHSGNVSAAELHKHGLLDILSSDYVPASLLQAVMHVVSDGAATLPEAVKLVTANPAAAIGLEDRGRIEVGKRADLIHVHVHHDTPRQTGEKHAPLPVVRQVWVGGRRVA